MTTGFQSDGPKEYSQGTSEDSLTPDPIAARASDYGWGPATGAAP